MADEDTNLQSGQTDNSGVKTDPSDVLTPDHPRFKDVLKENNELKEAVKDIPALKAEIEELQILKEEIAARQERTGNDEYTEDEVKALNRINKSMKSSGFVTKEDLDVMKKGFELNKMTDKYDGSNGYPKFVPEDVIEYAKRRGIGNFEDAYYALHRDTLISVEAKRLNNKPTVPDSERATGADRKITGTDLTEEKIQAMTPDEYEQNRERIKEAMKSSSRNK